MANTPAIEWIRIDDFRPGIAQQPGVGYPPGQAQAAGTFRCIADDSGALVPLPRRQTLISGIDYNSGDPDDGYWIVGFFIAGPILPTGGLAGASDTPIEAFIAVEYIDNDVRHFRTTLHKLYEPTPSTANIVSIDSAETSPASICRGVSFGLTRDYYPDETLPGIPIVVFHWFAGGGNDETFAWAFPDPNASNVDGVYEIVDDKTIERVTCHQNRVVLFETAIYSHGDDGLWTTNENVFWTLVNDISQLSQDVSPNTGAASIFVSENPTGYAVVTTMTAGELFLVKAFGGGGASILGDLDTASVQTLPNLPAVGYEGVDAARLEYGVLYPSRYAGAWVWTGGGSVQRVSSLLDNDFWFFDDIPIIGVSYSWATWGDWVAGPNNWLWDSTGGVDGQGSWWRLEDPSDVRIRWMREAIGQPQILTGAVSEYTSLEEDVAFAWKLYEQSGSPLLANNYTWVSHPLPSTIDREIDAKELMVTMMGEGTIDIILVGREGDSATIQFTVDSAIPVRERKSVKCTGSFIEVVVESTGADNGPAPEIHAIELGVQPLNIVGRNNVA